LKRLDKNPGEIDYHPDGGEHGPPGRTEKEAGGQPAAGVRIVYKKTEEGQAQRPDPSSVFVYVAAPAVTHNPGRAALSSFFR